MTSPYPQPRRELTSVSPWYKLPTEAASANAIDRNQYYTATEGTQLGTAVDDVSHSVVRSGAFGIKGQEAGYYNIVSLKVDGKLVAMHADDDEDKVQKAEGVREYKPNGKYRVRPILPRV